MRMARIAMAMEDGAGASSSSSAAVQPATAAAMAYGRVVPPPFWSTPTPYLFIGFAVVMALIAVALAVLLCSRRKEDQEAGRRADAEAAGVMSVVLAPLDREDAAMPKQLLVVMAPGHSAPSFLASAAPFACRFTTADTAADDGAAAKPPQQQQQQHGGAGKGHGDDAV